MVDFEYLKKYLDSQCTDEDVRVPGSTIRVHVGGKEVFNYTTGYKDLETKTILKGDEHFEVYSCTKVLTMVSAMMLYERGKWLPSDPVSDYLPKWKNMTVMNQNMQFAMPTDKVVTVGMLLTMTAGLNYDLYHPIIKKIREETNGECPTLLIADALGEKPLLKEPGETWMYSLCHDVVAGLIEVWSGMTYGEFCRKFIFEPLGMSDSTFDRSKYMDSKATPYKQDPITKQNKIEPNHEYVLGTKYESGGAGLITTADDYIKFLDGVISGKLISKYTMRYMATDRLTKSQRAVYDTWRGKRDYGYGFGVRVHTGYGGQDLEYNTPLGEFGWDGAAGSYLAIIPECDVTVFYAQQQLHQQGNALHSKMMNILMSALENEGCIKIK